MRVKSHLLTCKGPVVSQGRLYDPQIFGECELFPAGVTVLADADALLGTAEAATPEMLEAVGLPKNGVNDAPTTTLTVLRKALRECGMAATALRLVRATVYDVAAKVGAVRREVSLTFMCGSLRHVLESPLSPVRLGSSTCSQTRHVWSMFDKRP